MRPARPFLFDWKPPALVRPEAADDFVLLDEDAEPAPEPEPPPGGWVPRWLQPAPFFTKLRQIFLWKNLDELVPCPHCGSEATPRGEFVPEMPYFSDPHYYYCARCGGPLGFSSVFV